MQPLKETTKKAASKDNGAKDARRVEVNMVRSQEVAEFPAPDGNFGGRFLHFKKCTDNSVALQNFDGWMLGEIFLFMFFMTIALFKVLSPVVLLLGYVRPTSYDVPFHPLLEALRPFYYIVSSLSSVSVIMLCRNRMNESRSYFDAWDFRYRIWHCLFHILALFLETIMFAAYIEFTVYNTDPNYQPKPMQYFILADGIMYYIFIFFQVIYTFLHIRNINKTIRNGLIEIVPYPTDS